MSKVFFTKDEIEQARKVDLLDYMRVKEPENIKKICNGNYTTNEHSSLKISNGLWCWQSKKDNKTGKKIGGKNALDYLIKVKNLSFLTAVGLVLDSIGVRPEYLDKSASSNDKNQSKKDEEVTITSASNLDNSYIENAAKRTEKMKLPEPFSNNDRVINYLIGRGIDKNILMDCINNKTIYEDKNHNVVFVGYDEQNEPKFSSVRATNSSRFMHDVSGSDKRYSFRLLSENRVSSIYLFESAIDLLSFATLIKLEGKNYKNFSLISLAGVYQPAKEIGNSKVPIAIETYLNNNPTITKIYVCFDNDKAGIEAKNALENVIKSPYIVQGALPKYEGFNGKDYNDFLIYTLAKMKQNS